MATIQQSYQRYMAYNLTGKGQDHGNTNHHSWRGPIYYYADKAVQRIVKRPGKSPALLMVHGLYSWLAKENFELVVVEDIAVFSKYEGDWLSDEQMHNRQRYLMICRLNDFIDNNVAGWTNQNCALPQTRRNAEKTLANYMESYEHYTTVFDLNWPRLSNDYAERMATTIIRKGERWTDPDAMKKRDRAAARRLAKQALGLE